MYRYFIICTLIALFAFPSDACAQSSVPDEKLSAYKEKLRRYQHQVIARELSLSREESNKFFPIYDKMCDELERVGRETRVLEQRTINNPNASAVECENVARALFEQKKAEADIELRYFEQFKELLAPRQLLLLKGAEETFRKEVMAHFAKHYKRRADK